MSIRARLIIGLGLLLLSTIGAMVTAMLVDARARVSSEVASSIRTTETLMRSALEPIERGEGDASQLAPLVSGLQHLRHVQIYLKSARPLSEDAPPMSDREAWAEYIAGVPGPTVTVPVVIKGKHVDTVVIVPQSADEMEEVLETIGRLSVYALIFAAAAFPLTGLLINRALEPVHALGTAMHAMESGNYDIGITQQGPPEIARICSQLNRLAAALKKTRAENQRLSTAMVRIQDEERRDIARDLHDELGPFLFSIRATGAALIRKFQKPEFDVSKAVDLTENILEHVDSLQATNRRVLQQLSPVGLSELGLKGVLRANIDMWKRQPHSCDVEIELEGDLDALDETISTTVYRIVQEGVTNALRHANPTVVRASVVAEDGSGDGPGEVRIEIRDDGLGLPDETQPGYGLRGMHERVGALGGELTISPSENDNGGTLLRARIPLAAASLGSAKEC